MFRELYDRWAERLLAYFYRRVVDAEVAADLLAETFAVAFERRRRFRDTPARCLTAVRRAARPARSPAAPTDSSSAATRARRA